MTDQTHPGGGTGIGFNGPHGSNAAPANSQVFGGHYEPDSRMEAGDDLHRTDDGHPEDDRR